MKKPLWYPFVFFSFAVMGLAPLSCRSVKSLGKNPEGADLKKIEALPNYKSGEFQNLETLPAIRSTTTVNRGPRWTRMLKYFFGKPKITRPSKLVPMAITDLKNAHYQKPTVTWFGHSSFLIQSATGTVLLDPVFNNYAGPIGGLVKAFDGTNGYDARDMPEIDALIISHDHYDHLDYRTVKELKKKVKRVIVPIGVGSHFRHWGYEADRITELNWNDSVSVSPGFKVTATPAHHRSNRTFKQQRKTLWASYVIELGGYKIYFSGDTGYSKHFKLIGEQYGPFDLALMECGQYNKNWSQSHMHPTQSVQAAIDIRSKMTIPMHWGKFAESDHPWSEPVEIFISKADSVGMSVSTPVMGQPYGIGDTVRHKWWMWDKDTGATPLF